MERVLIADNDTRRGESLAAMLMCEGVDVSMATTGQEAYETALAVKPEWVFLDVALTVFSGTEVASMLRNDPEIDKATRIVLLSRRSIGHHELAACGADLALENIPDHAELRELLSRYEA